MTELVAFTELRARDTARRRPRRVFASLTVHSRASGAPQLLPAWECVGGRTSARQYAFDGRRVVLVDPQAFREASSSRASPLAGFSPQALARSLARLKQRCAAALLPDEESVTEEYWAYSRWRFVQRVAAQTLTVLATQQMLRAVGMGASRTLPAAAALNWVLKDGLGRIGKLSVATRFGRTFDSDAKRSRFASSCVYDAAALLEMCTPLAPAHFLLLATLANVGKSVGITTAQAVRGPIQKSFAKEENLADIAARTAAQQVLADSSGLALAVALSAATARCGAMGAHPAFPLLFFPPLAAADLWAIRRQLRAVTLSTLNKERCELAAEHWLATGRAPSASQVAQRERLLSPPLMDSASSNLPLRIGALRDAARSGDELMRLLATPSARGSGYVLALHPAGRPVARLALQAGATSPQIVQALLQVGHLRRLPARPELGEEERARWALDQSFRLAQRDREPFLRALRAEKWQTDNFLLSSAERAPYIRSVR